LALLVFASATGFLTSREGQRVVRGVLGGLLGGGSKRKR
jgi:hypothetical protein